MTGIFCAGGLFQVLSWIFL